ncbi:MAG: hypothetical protein IJV20_03380 [Prevotella sp.]|nr:hypothetical protein [Prevotella sp.]
MRINKIYAGIMGLMALMMLPSCSTQVDSTSIEQPVQETNTIVRFSLGKGFVSRKAYTRATDTSAQADQPSFTNEKTIDELYAVVFRNNKFYRTFLTSYVENETATGLDVYEFNMGAAGAYTMYLVANPDAALKAKIYGDPSTPVAPSELTKDTSEPNDFFKIVATQTPGNNVSTTRFLMLSPEINVPIDASNAVATVVKVGGSEEIKMTRRMSRIDIDATALGSDFKIKEVVFHNRYKSSLIRRLDSWTTMDNTAAPVDLTTAANLEADYIYVSDPSNKTSIATTDYGTATSEDLSAVAASGVEAIRTDREWKGCIYGYENTTELASNSEIDAATAKTGGITVIEVIGDLHGIEVRHNVVFATRTGDPTPTTETITLKQNYLYNIVLTLKDIPDEYAPLQASIQVIDFVTGEIVKETNEQLTDQTSVPTVTESGTSVADGATINAAQTGAVITLTVVSKQSAARLVCTDTDDETRNKITSVVENTPYAIDADGRITQTFVITLTDNDEGAPRNFHFKVANALSSNNAAVSFTITQAGS